MQQSTARRKLVAYNGYDSGLGNRVRVVLGSRSLADLEGRDFAYVWPTGSLFGPRFNELWDFRGRTLSRSTSRVLAWRFPYRDETLGWITEGTRREWLWQIRTGSPINLPSTARPWQDELRALQPVPEIASAVTDFFDAELRGTAYVGVMIRAHSVSHGKTRQASPVDWFIRRMREILAEAPGTRFFVSCDVPEVQQRVIDAVPGCCAQRDKGGYNSTAGVRSAIADLYLLASSGYLLGPHFSSFVHLAEHLAGDRLTFETSVLAPGDTSDKRSHGLVTDPLRPYQRSREC